MNQKQKALIYCRVSSERQKNEGNGLASQEHRCRIYCDQKNYEIEKVFRDTFSGGGDFMKRPGMPELIRHLDERPYENNYVIVFDDISRLARDTAAHLKLRATFKGRNAKVECLNFNFDESPEGQFSETVMAANAELTRLQNRRQVIQKQKARFEAGYWPFYPPPGYRSVRSPIHGKLLTPFKPEAGQIKEALEGFASDRFHSQGDVWRFFQSINYANKKNVNFQLVNRLFLRIAVYAGFIEYTPWEVTKRAGHHQPLINLETYQRICDKLNGKVSIRTRKDVREDFPLRNTIIVCGKCEKPFTASYSRKSNGSQFPYYRCGNNKGCEEHKKSTRKDVIEPAFELLLQGIKPKPSVLKISEAIFLDLWGKRLVWLAENEKKIQEQRSNIKNEIEILVGRIKKSESERVRKIYEIQIDELAKQEERLGDKSIVLNHKKDDFRTALRMVFDYLKDPYYRWKNGSLAEKRMVLQLVFQGALPYDRGIGFRTAPLSLPLRVFEHFATSKSQDVEMAGIEPAYAQFVQ